MIKSSFYNSQILYNLNRHIYLLLCCLQTANEFIQILVKYNSDITYVVIIYIQKLLTMGVPYYIR